MEAIRLLIIDDHQMVRAGLRDLLETGSDRFRFVIREADTGEEGFRMSCEAQYEIIFLDFNMPGMNGVDTAKMILEKNPNAKILMLSALIEFVNIERLINTGVKGILLKNTNSEELILAVTTIMKGEPYFSKDVALDMIKYRSIRSQKQDSGKNEGSTKELSEREIEILQFISAENSSKEIADKLGLSKRTVDKHRANIIKKLNVKNTAGLVKYAIEYFGKKQG